MRLLVIGGTKFIGPHVVRQLAAGGHRVTVFHRGATEAALPSGVEHIHDLAAGIPVVTYPASLLEQPFDIVIHMIPMGEDDALAAVESFRHRVSRLVVLSSGDVYLAYGRFTELEPGPVEESPLTEQAPLRSVLYPYRKAASPGDWMYRYEKILVERTVLREPTLPAVVLRLPKVYGPGGNADLATMYGCRAWPYWRWTHGYVENVARAIVLAALHPKASGIYNVGEERTPSVAERLADLPRSSLPDMTVTANFAQNLVYDTSRIRHELGYTDIVEYGEGLRRTVALSDLPR